MINNLSQQYCSGPLHPSPGKTVGSVWPNNSKCPEAGSQFDNCVQQVMDQCYLYTSSSQFYPALPCSQTSLIRLQYMQSKSQISNNNHQIKCQNSISKVNNVNCWSYTLSQCELRNVDYTSVYVIQSCCAVQGMFTALQYMSDSLALSQRDDIHPRLCNSVLL